MKDVVIFTNLNRCNHLCSIGYLDFPYSFGAIVKYKVSICYIIIYSELFQLEMI